jgi:hypothetical protein
MNSVQRSLADGWNGACRRRFHRRQDQNLNQLAAADQMGCLTVYRITRFFGGSNREPSFKRTDKMLRENWTIDYVVLGQRALRISILI